MYWDHNKSPKKTRNQMNVPYYILVNDEDKEHIKYYHDYLYGRTPYESEWGDRSAANAVILKGGSDALNSNRAIVYMIRETLESVGIDPNSIIFIEDTDTGDLRKFVVE